MNVKWQVTTLVGLILGVGLVVAQVSPQEARTSGAPDEWQGAPATQDGLTLTVSAPDSLRFQPDQDIPLTFSLGNGGTETAYVAILWGGHLQDERGYRVIPGGRVDEPGPPEYSALVDGNAVYVVPVVELKPGEEIIETVEDMIERLHPLPRGTYRLIPIAQVETFDRDSVITTREIIDERYTQRTCAQPEFATSRFKLATEPITILIQAAGTALPKLGKLAEAQEQTISIQLMMEQRTFLSGEPVPVTIRMKNVSNTRLITDQLFKRGTERIDKLAHYIHVVDSTGDRLSPMYPTDAPGIPDGRPEVIGPDWTRTVSLSDLREHFRFLNKAGTYTVQVRFGTRLYEAIRADGSIPWQSPSWSGVIESNKLAFTILEKRAERPQPQPSFEQWEEAENMLELSLSLSAQEAVIGDPLTATVTLSNEADNAQPIVEQGPYPCGTHLIVTREAGEPLRYEGVIAQYCPMYVELRSGEERVHEFEVTTLFHLSMPSVYVVRAYHGISQKDTGTIFSQPVQFRLTEGTMVFSERAVWRKKAMTPMGFRIGPDSYTSEMRGTHEVKVLQSETGLTAVYRWIDPDKPDERYQVLLDNVKAKTVPVLMVDEYGMAHILVCTSPDKYRYWVYRPDQRLRKKNGMEITPEKRALRFPPELCKDTRGKVFLRRPTH